MSEAAVDRLIDVGARSLVHAAREGTLPPAWFREDDARAVLDQLERGRNVLLVGPAGVGKTALVHSVARALADKGGALVELSTTQIMSGTKYLGEWETRITEVMDAARSGEVIVYFTDVWNVPFAGKTMNSERNFLDAMAPYLRGQVRLLAEATPDVLKVLERTPRLADLFVKHTVAPLSPRHVDEVLDNAARDAAFPVDAAMRKTLVSLTDRFLPSRPQPGPALALLRRAAEYAREKAHANEDSAPTAALIERVFAIHSGLPAFVVSSAETRRAEEIRAWFRERIVGQHEAIEAIVETIALFKAGLCDPDKPLGTFLFVGPTGVGKTEVARAVAQFLFGSPSRLLRFDLSELKDYHAFEQLVGSAKDPHQPARLVDPVRAQPFQVVLLDEIEKAHANVWDLILPLLDEGRLTPPNGNTVDFRRTIVIATSNVGAEDADKSVGFGASTDEGTRRARIRERLAQSFRPELLNRFGHVIVFHALDKGQVKQICRAEIKHVLAREGLTGRNLVVEVDDGVVDAVVDRGYDARWGARGLKREIQHRVVMPLALALLEQDVAPGTLLKVSLRDGRPAVRIVDTDASRAALEPARPVKVQPGRKLDRDGIVAAATAAGLAIEAIAEGVSEPLLIERRRNLTALREDPQFWRDTDAAAIVIRDIDRANLVLDRLERLRERARKLVTDASTSRTKAANEEAGRRLVQLEEAVAVARRELVAMGANGHWDALVEVAPIGAPAARDEVVRLYLAWAKHRGFTSTSFVSRWTTRSPRLSRSTAGSPTAGSRARPGCTASRTGMGTRSPGSAWRPGPIYAKTSRSPSTRRSSARASTEDGSGRGSSRGASSCRTPARSGRTETSSAS